MKNQTNLLELKEEPFPPDIETILINLNRLIGYFMAYEENNAVNTLWHAEQLIKNNIENPFRENV